MAEKISNNQIPVLRLSAPGVIGKTIVEIQKGSLVVNELSHNFGYLVDPRNTEAINHIREAKKDSDINKPFSAILPTEYFVNMIDYDRIPQELHELLHNPQELEKRIGLICHLRAPIKNEFVATLPPSLISWKEKIEDGMTIRVPYVQNFFIHGNEGMVKLRDQLFEKGMLLAVTTQNEHGTPEITTLKESLVESERVRASIILIDKGEEGGRPEVKGSWSIVELENLEVVRDGRIPVEMIRFLLHENLKVNKDMKRANYVQDPAFVAFIKDLQERKLPETVVHEAIILYLAGLDINTVLQQISSIK